MTPDGGINIKKSVSILTVHMVGVRVAPIRLAWREDNEGGHGESVSFTDHANGLVITLGMMGRDRVSLEIAAVEPDNGV